MSDELVTIGRIVKPHGIRGEVAVDVLSDVPDRLAEGVEVVVDGRPRRISASRPHQGRMLVRFEGIGDRTQAETLRNQRIEATPVDPDGSDAFFVHELIDLEVVDEQERSLGRVRALIDLPTAAEYDLLEVAREDGSRWLLPAVDDYVEVEELAGGELRLRVVDPPDGLLDLDGSVGGAAPTDPSGEGS